MTSAGKAPQPRASRPRIVDVAAVAGVSAQTVSNVINGRGGFTDETRARVETAIEQLGFQPNRYAQSLRSRRTMLLGFDMSGDQLDATNPFTISFLRALVQAASAHAYRVVAFTHEGDRLDDFRATVASGAVDGFVLSDSAAEDRRARVLSETGVPFVVFGRTAPDLPQTWVDIDNGRAIADAVDHLLAAGRRSFGYVGFPLTEYWNHDRYEGVRERLRANGCALPEEATVIGMPADLKPAIRRMLSRPDRPDAVVTSSDSIAVLVVNAAHALGLRVGRDLAVTGFDSGPLQSIVEPTLTSVRIPVDDIAVALVQRLLDELGGRPRDGGEIVGTTLTIGGSA